MSILDNLEKFIAKVQLAKTVTPKGSVNTHAPRFILHHYTISTFFLLRNYYKHFVEEKGNLFTSSAQIGSILL